MDGRVQVRDDGILRIEILVRDGVDAAPIGSIDLSPLHLRADGRPFLAPGQDELVLEAMRSAGMELPPDAWISVADGYAFSLDDRTLVAELTATVEPPDDAPRSPDSR